MEKNIIYRTNKGTIIANHERVVLCDAVYGAKFDDGPHPYLLTAEESLKEMDPRKRKLDMGVPCLTRYAEDEKQVSGPITGRIEIPRIRVYSRSKASEDKTFAAVMTYQNTLADYVNRLERLETEVFSGVLKEIDRFVENRAELDRSPTDKQPVFAHHLGALLMSANSLATFGGFANTPEIAALGPVPTIDDFI